MANIGDVQFRFAEITYIDKLISFWSIDSKYADRPIVTRDLVEQLIVKDLESITIAINEGRILGSIISGWDGWRGSIYRITVDN